MMLIKSLYLFFCLKHIRFTASLSSILQEVKIKSAQSSHAFSFFTFIYPVTHRISKVAMVTLRSTIRPDTKGTVVPPSHSAKSIFSTDPLLIQLCLLSLLSKLFPGIIMRTYLCTDKNNPFFFITENKWGCLYLFSSVQLVLNHGEFLFTCFQPGLEPLIGRQCLFIHLQNIGLLVVVISSDNGPKNKCFN